MTPLWIILNPQMRLILKVSADQCRENLLISDKVAIIIPDEYNDTSFCDIVLAEYTTPNEPLRYYYISSAYAAYILLHYMLLFPRGDTGWY